MPMCPNGNNPEEIRTRYRFAPTEWRQFIVKITTPTSWGAWVEIGAALSVRERGRPRSYQSSRFTNKYFATLP